MRLFHLPLLMLDLLCRGSNFNSCDRAVAVGIEMLKKIDYLFAAHSDVKGLEFVNAHVAVAVGIVYFQYFLKLRTGFFSSGLAVAVCVRHGHESAVHRVALDHHSASIMPPIIYMYLCIIGNMPPLSG